MKKTLILCLLCLLLWGCGPAEATENPVDTTAWLNMGLSYPVVDCLPDGQGQSAKVILLLGQSNATGCSLTDYLQKGVSEEKYAEFAAGYENVQINFCLDDHKYTTGGGFIPTALHCGAGQGYFGPELGMAEVLSETYPQEQIFILKYTMSGYSLHHHWLCAGQRARFMKPAWAL